MCLHTRELHSLVVGLVGSRACARGSLLLGPIWFGCIRHTQQTARRFDHRIRRAGGLLVVTLSALALSGGFTARHSPISHGFAVWRSLLSQCQTAQAREDENLERTHQGSSRRIGDQGPSNTLLLR